MSYELELMNLEVKKWYLSNLRLRFPINNSLSTILVNVLSRIAFLHELPSTSLLSFMGYLGLIFPQYFSKCVNGEVVSSTDSVKRLPSSNQSGKPSMLCVPPAEFWFPSVHSKQHCFRDHQPVFGARRPWFQSPILYLMMVLCALEQMTYSLSFSCSSLKMGKIRIRQWEIVTEK